MKSIIFKLIDLLKKAPGQIYIQPHDVPDPDAIASAFALGQLLSIFGINPKLVYGREYHKIDAKRMVELLGIKLFKASDIEIIEEESWIVIVDGQKGNANLGLLSGKNIAAIDHHELRKDAAYIFSDIRPEVGSCSAIISEYYKDTGHNPDRLVATALSYGILIDTDGLTRGVSELDIAMLHWLHSFTDIALLRKLRSRQLVLDDLRILADGFKTVELIYRLALMRLDGADDSLIGSANDIILSLDEADASIAYSFQQDGIRLSVRSTINPEISRNDLPYHPKEASWPPRADELIKTVIADIGFGGGHSYMAGGFIPFAAIADNQDAETIIKTRLREYLEKQNKLP